MTEQEARGVLTDFYQKVDWLNLPRVLQTLGEFGLDWRKFDNSYFRPDYNKGWKDVQYLEKNMDKLYEAIKFLKNKS